MSMQARPVLIEVATCAYRGILLAVLSCCMCGCGGGGHNQDGANRYSFATWSLQSAQSPLDKLYGATSDGRLYGGAQTDGDLYWGMSNPDGGSMTSHSGLSFMTAQVRAACTAANRVGNLLVLETRVSSSIRYTAWYADSVSDNDTTYVSILPSGASGQDSPIFPASVNLKKEILLKQKNTDGTFSLFYEASPGAAMQLLYTSATDIQASIDDNSGILIFTDHAMFMDSRYGPSYDLKDASGKLITDKCDHSPDGTVLVHSYYPAYFSPGDHTHIKSVAKGAARNVAVSFVNSKGGAGGNYTDSNGNIHPCIWTSLDQPPLELGQVVPGATLTNVDYAFDSGVLIARDTIHNKQYILTPLP